MKLHEIVNAVLNDEELIYEKIAPYKNSLYIYFKDYFCYEPVLMVTFVCNAVQGCKIVSSNEFNEAICHYLNDFDCSNEESENFAEYETICFNSLMLSDV